MSCEIEPVSPETELWRLGRAEDAWAWPDWAYAGPDGSFGNRYDDPRAEYRVLYASSERVGALIEGLARLRPDPVLVEALGEIEGDDAEEVTAGTVPAEWLRGRVIGWAGVGGDFAAVGHSRSLAYLREVLAWLARAHGLGELDAATIRLRAPRAFTQAVSRHVFECERANGSPQFAGIHYRSRLGDEFGNWAIFEPSEGEPPIVERGSEPLSAEDPDLLVALEHLGLRLD